MNVKFGWATKDDQALYQSLIASSAVLGLTIGAIFGGKIITIGRRKSYILSCVLGIAGVLLTLVTNVPCILAGRLIFGLSTGILCANVPKYVEETIPANHLGLFGTIFPWSMGIGSIGSTVLGLGLPDDEDVDALRNSEFWKFIFGAPLIFFGIGLFSFIFIIKHDSPKYLVNTN
jgi:MFS family permease